MKNSRCPRWDVPIWILTGLFVFAGCAARQPDVLRHAGLELTRARQDAVLVQHAPVELAQAEQTYREAERVWQEDENLEEASRLAGTVESQLQAARDVAAVVAKARYEEELLRKERQLRRAEEEAEELSDRLEELGALQTAEGVRLSLGTDLLFETDEAVMRSGGERRLDPLVRYLRAHPGTRVEIEGHTDSTGTEAYNRDLSTRRAEAVRRFLEEQGIRPERLTARGLGEDYPVASNATAAGRLQNRRVEVLVRRRA